MSMRSLPFSLPLGLAMALALTGGCHGDDPGGPIDGKQSTTTAAGDAERAISQAGKALAFTIASDGTLSKTADATGSSVSAVMPTMGNAVPPAMLKAMVGPALTAQATGVAMPSMMTTQEKFDQIGSEIHRLMTERLFVDSNLESNGGGTATYLLKPDPSCRPLPADDAPAGTIPDIDSKCQMNFTKVEVRVAVSSDGDGARLRFLVGPQRLELVVFIIHSDLLAAEVNLPQTKAAVDYINSQLETGDSPTGSYDELAGKLRSSIQLVGTDKVTFAMAILEAVDVAQTNGTRVTTAATNPLYAITGDGVAKTAELQMGYGATEVDTTWDPNGTGVTNRDAHFTMGGYYGKYTLDDGAKTVTLTDVGIGETMIAVRGNTIFDLNLNRDSMRRFSGLVHVNADNTAHIEVTPKFDVSLAFDYSAVANDFSAPPSMTVAHDTYGVALGNGGATTAVDTVASTGAFNGGLRVVSGVLTLSAASAPDQTVTVPAGKCLTSMSGGAPAGTNALLGALVVTDCP